MNKGFTMLETLLVSLFIPVIMSFVVSLLVLMNNFEITSLNQDDVFKVQIRQLLSRSLILECDEELRFLRNNKEFEIVLDKNRIVKKPGFEILLFGVDDLYFETVDHVCQISYLKEGEQRIEIRPQD